MAFNKATHPSLLQALQMLHPGVDIPSAHQLSTTLLNMCYRDFKVKMVHKITGKKCTLYTDGWTDVNGKSVINYVLECEGETYFLESVYTGSTSHDTLFLAADVKKVIKSAKFSTIVAVVTDNTAASQLMWSTDVFFSWVHRARDPSDREGHGLQVEIVERSRGQLPKDGEVFQEASTPMG
ncbi:hypothetical protein PR002_g308 [Phytophthora rubi]|uniref:DUF659 domain-containing protein n=1 Tax=Phytophthora rubi TaxID=129364 RepID=A0A6A3NTF6_9STRA|nr:hypothetical protein PR002_g306 [Phytophthora rubi]KAE9048731.1 hypothetical protein PR002_g308 [Phytophthora rubi]